MSGHERACACGRDAVDVVSVASQDGVLLIAVCAECIEDPAAGDQSDLFGVSERRRPLAAMPARDDDQQQSLPLRDSDDVDQAHGAA